MAASTSRVLIIEDDPSTRRALADMLREDLRMVQFDLATSVAEALYAATVARYEAIVCDLSMPHIDALGLIDRLRHINRLTPIAALSESRDPELYAEAHAHGAVFVIRKPIERASAVQAIAAMLSPAAPANSTRDAVTPYGRSWRL